MREFLLPSLSYTIHELVTTIHTELIFQVLHYSCYRSYLLLCSCLLFNSIGNQALLFVNQVLLLINLALPLINHVLQIISNLKNCDY